MNAEMDVVKFSVRMLSLPALEATPTAKMRVPSLPLNSSNYRFQLKGPLPFWERVFVFDIQCLDQSR